MYLGPDAALPFASALAAIAGVLLMFWHRTVAAVKRLARWLGIMRQESGLRREEEEGKSAPKS